MLTGPLPSRFRGELGFTLIETLVAMVAGLIVMGALYAILEVSLHQSTRLTDVASATQSGRITLTHMVDQLHSACVSAKFSPVKEGSSETKLILVDGYSEKSSLPPTSLTPSTGKEGVRKDTLEWTETPLANANKEGTLRDKTRLGTSEPNGEGEYGYAEESPKGGTVIGERISASETKNAKGETPPMFTYWAYATKAAASTEAASSTLTEIKPSPTLTGAQAKTVAAVGLNFHALPPDKASTINHTIKETGVDLNSLVTLAFSAPSSEATIKAGPCE